MASSPPQQNYHETRDWLGDATSRLDQPQLAIRHSKITVSEGQLVACLSALEILIWQLTYNKILPSEVLADELTRYGRLRPEAQSILELFARIARAAGKMDAV
jgi:hypothetical protein